MKHRTILIAAVVAGLFGATFSSYAHNGGCYSETREEGINLCNRGFHQKAIEYFEAAKKCTDAPARNDLDALIASCRAHMSDFSIVKMELGNTDEFLEPVCEFDLPLYQDNLLYLTPRITCNSTREETLTLGIKVFEPDGSLSGGDDNEYSYVYELSVTPGTNQVYQLTGWGSSRAGSYAPGKYRIEIWSRGKLYATRDFEVFAGRDPVEAHYAIAGEAGEDSGSAPAAEGDAKLLVNGKEEPCIEFGAIGAIVHMSVENHTGVDYATALLPDFCSVQNITPEGFDLVCEPNKTPAVRSDWFWVYADESFVTITVKQATYATASFLRVDGKYESANGDFSYEGGKLIFFVETDGPDYCFWGIPSFCHVESQKPGSFFLVCDPNDYKIDRTDYFYVCVGDKKVEVNVTQAANPNGQDVSDDFDGDGDDAGPSDMSTDMGSENIFSNPDLWLETIRSMMDNPTAVYSDGSKYKGQTNSNGQRDGYGIYYWPVNSYYIGEWKNDERDGMGMYVIGDFTYSFSNCPGAKVYVGMWKEGKANGIGSCYDANGVLIYDGEFVDGVPGDDYPNGENYTGYMFQIFHRDGRTLGKWYMGETYGTNRIGWGLLMWDDFDCCFGKWEDDNRTNQLFMERSGEVIEMRDYNE